MAIKRVRRGFTADCLVSFPPSSAEPHQEECSRGAFRVSDLQAWRSSQSTSYGLSPTSQADHSLTTRLPLPSLLTFPCKKKRMEMSNLQLYNNITNKIIWSWLKLQLCNIISSTIPGGVQGSRAALSPPLRLCFQLSQLCLLEALMDSTYPAHSQSQEGSWRFPEPWICF